MSLKPGELFHDRYLLKDMKGRGSFGEVWLARDQKLDIDVAIKVYIALDTRGVEEFKTEFKTTFGLNHPNLLRANHFDICEDRPYLVMPYCPDSSMKLIGKADEPTIWRFIYDVASGLEYLHGMGIVHHDIKPDNILVNENGQFVITDFGISVRFRSTLRRNSSRQVQNEIKGGSMAYMAPEMFTEEAEAVNATDIWALGATLYEIVTGSIPFFGQSGVMQLKGAVVPDISGPFSDRLKNVIKDCLAKECWDRPTAKQLVQFAQEALGENDKGTVMEGKMPDSTPKKGKKIAIIGGIAAVVIIGVVALLLGLKKKPTPPQPPTPFVEEHEDAILFMAPDSTQYTYSGETDDAGVPNGQGVAIGNDYKYEGSFKDGMFDGYGILDLSTNGDVRVYEGYFSNHQIDSGRLVSGSLKFEGKFKDKEFWNGVVTQDGKETIFENGEVVLTNN